MFSRKHSTNRILDARDSVVRKLHGANRSVARSAKRIFWNYGIAKIYYKTIEFFAKSGESIGFVFGYIWHLILSGTVHSSTAESIRKAGDTTKKKVNRSWEEFAENIGKKAEQSIFTAWIVKILRRVRKILRAIFGFWIDWLWTRNFWLLLGAIPATVLTLPVAYFLFRIPFQTNNGIAKNYQKAVQRAIDADDFQAVALYNRRLAQLGDRPMNNMAFNSALSLAEKGQLEEAHEQMKTLASLDTPGFGPAHLWMAHHLQSGDIRAENQNDDEVNALVKQHLQHALKLLPDSPQAAHMLAAAHFAAGAKDQAREVLNSHKHLFQEPLDRLRAAGVYQLLGDMKTAQTLLRGAEETTNTREQFEKQLPPIHYIGKAEIELAKRQADSAIATLKKGHESHPDNEAIAKFLAELLRDHYDRTRTLYEPSQRLDRLNEILALAPSEIETLKRISGLAEVPSIAAEATSVLAASLQEEDIDKAIIYNLLGSAYAVQGNMQKSREAYEEVVQNTSTDAESFNNLAWLYSHEPPIDLKKAAEFADKAIAIEPSNPHYRDTRGHVHMLSENWQDAVTELRKALNGMPDNRKTHAALANCYRRMNNVELAKQHDELAKQ
ncbi:MAG: hypothetical protein KDB27_27745 [Planctomycetales bacterium]|nr:hypothetical protein [Planctomycetales bacterium]